MDYETLVDIYRKEMASSELVKVDPNFYTELKKLLEEKKKSLSEDDLLSQKEYWNLKKMVSRIVSKRIQKIIIAASEDIEVEATPEEQELYARVKGAIEGFKSGIETVKENKPREEEKEEEVQTNLKKIKIIKFVEKYIGENEKVYGPYNVGDIVEIEKEEAEWLISTGYAEEA